MAQDDELIFVAELPALGSIGVKQDMLLTLVFDAQAQRDLAALVGSLLDVGKADGRAAGNVSVGGNQYQLGPTGVGKHVEYSAQLSTQRDLGKHVTHQHRADQDVILWIMEQPLVLLIEDLEKQLWALLRFTE